MSTSSRRRGGWVLAFVLALGALVAGGLFLLETGGGEAVDADRAVAPTAVSATNLVAEGDDATRANALSELAPLAADGLVVRPGVRLAGPGRLEGRVLERESGRGVEGARVELFSVPPAGRDFLGRVYRAAKFDATWNRRLEPIATVATGLEGRFSFEGVRNGSYFLEARGAWHVPDHTALVRVDSDGAGGPVDCYVRTGGRVVGVVRTGGGRPVSGAEVTVYAGHTRFLAAARLGDFRMITARTARDGGFVVAGVPPGAGYDLAVSGDGMAITHLTDFVVEAGRDTEVEVVARTGATVTGQVLARVPTPSGDEKLVPVAGAHVGALPRGLRDLGFAREVLAATHAISDADGRYVMRRVPPGEIDVAAAKQGLVPAKSPSVRTAEGVLAQAEPVVLDSGPTVTLVLVNDEGAPIPGASTSWFVTDFDELQFEPTFTPLMIQAVEGFEFPKSDADGRVVAGPFPGSAPYSIFCWKAGHEFDIVEWDPPRDGDEVRVVLSRGGAVEGIVMDVEAAEPVKRFQIRTSRRLDYDEEAPSTINPFSGGRWVEDENGRFRIDALADWNSDVTFVAPGYLPEALSIAVTPGETTRGVIVKLRRGGTIRGRVVDSEGEPIGGAQVAALDERGRAVAGRMRNPRQSSSSFKSMIGQEIAMGSMEVFSALGVLGSGFVVSEPDGSFELTGLPEQEIAVHATHRDFADGKTGLMAVGAGAPIEDVEVVLTTGGGIYGKVTDRFGQPIAGALLLAVSTAAMADTYPSARWVHQAGTDAAGEYRIEHMEPGGYFLACTRGDEGLNLVSFLGTLNFDLVTVPPNEMVSYDITDSSASAVRVYGRITADGEPVTGGGIFALGFESENVLGLDVKIAQVKRDGTYAFEGLAPGEYQFTYQRDGPEVRMDVEIPDVPEHRLDLELPAGGIAGRVVDSTTGEPLRNCELVLERKDAPTASGLIGAMIQREGRNARDWTDRDGAFEFRRLQAGEYQLKVGPPRWGELRGRYAPPDPMDVEVTEGVVLEGVEIALVPSLELSGVVRGADGGPIHRARVYAFAREDRDVRPSSARTDEAGSFTLRSLAPGTYDVTASAADYADSLAQEVEVTGGSDPPLDILLHRGVEVVVRVTGPDGRPLQGATGRLVAREGSVATKANVLDRAIEGLFTGEGVSGPDGVLKLGRYAPGNYRLEVGRGTLSASKEPVRLEDGPPVELNVGLK